MKNWDQFVGLALLFIFVLLMYFGAVQRNGSAYFENYISLKTANIEGSGAVYGYIMSAPVVETVLAFFISIFLIGLFFLTQAIYLKWTSATGKVFLTVIIITPCLWGIVSAFGNIVMYAQWNFSILMLSECAFLLYLIYYIFFSVSLQKRSVRDE